MTTRRAATHVVSAVLRARSGCGRRGHREGGRERAACGCRWPFDWATATAGALTPFSPPLCLSLTAATVTTAPPLRAAAAAAPAPRRFKATRTERDTFGPLEVPADK